MRSSEAGFTQLYIEHQSFSHSTLIQSLYWIWDAFDRALIKMFVVGPTHESIKNNNDLSGDTIHVGVRRLEWESGSRSVFNAFAGAPEEENKELAKYNHNGIIVLVHVYEDDPSINTLDSKMYFGENFNLPTPYSRFQKYLWK